LSIEQEKAEGPDDDRIRNAKRQVDRDNIILGRELYIAFSTGAYKTDGFTPFEDYSLSRGVDPRRSRLLRRQFVKFSKELGVPFERMLTVGYGRLKIIAPVINRGNKDLWLSRAEILDHLALSRKVGKCKLAKKKKKVKRKLIKHETGARDRRYSPEDAAALIAGITDDRLKPSADGETIISDDVVYARTIYLIGDQNTVFDTAINNMEQRTGSTKMGYLLTSALEEQLAHEATRGLKDDGRMHYFMEVLERRYKGRLIWVKDKKVAAELAEQVKLAEEVVARKQKEKEDKKNAPDQA